MPELKFYIENKIRKDLFNYLKETGSTIIPDLMYVGKTYDEIDDAETFLDMIENQTVHFFIINPLFTDTNLIIEKNKFITEGPKHYILQRKGGFCIDMSLYRGYTEDSPIKMKRTDLHYYSKFINNDNSDEREAPESMGEYFIEIKEFIISKCKKVEVGGKYYYVGEGEI